MEEIKICLGCGSEKPIGEFPVYKSRGVFYHRRLCAPCAKKQKHEYMARYRDTPTGREKIREAARRYNDSEKGKEQRKKFYEQHPDYSAAQWHKWAGKNPDRVKEIQERFLESHPDYYRDMAREKAKIAREMQSQSKN